MKLLSHFSLPLVCNSTNRLQMIASWHSLDSLSVRSNKKLTIANGPVGETPGIQKSMFSMVKVQRRIRHGWRLIHFVLQKGRDNVFIIGLRDQSTMQMCPRRGEQDAVARFRADFDLLIMEFCFSALIHIV